MSVWEFLSSLFQLVCQTVLFSVIAFVVISAAVLLAARSKRIVQVRPVRRRKRSNGTADVQPSRPSRLSKENFKLWSAIFVASGCGLLTAFLVSPWAAWGVWGYLLGVAVLAAATAGTFFLSR